MLRPLVSVLFLSLTSVAQAQSPDWNAVESEALKTLQGYVRINTSNPPGDVTKAADYLSGILKAEGIDVKRYESGAGRSILLARLKGNGTGGKAILLLSHMDVVPTDASRWAKDPFGAETSDAVREYAAPLKDAAVDTVILGCTHYPLIRPIFQRVFGRDVTLVFSAEETAREVAQTLARKGYENDPQREGTYRFLTTGDPHAFREMGARFLQLPVAEVEHVDIAALAAA